MRFTWERVEDHFYVLDGKQGSLLRGCEAVCICFDPDLAEKIVNFLNSDPRLYKQGTICS